MRISNIKVQFQINAGPRITLGAFILNLCGSGVYSRTSVKSTKHGTPTINEVESVRYVEEENK